MPMKALVSESYGPLEELTVSELPIPIAQPGQILVRVEAASLNGTDIKLPTGAMKGVPLKHPFVPGIDGAGVVEAVGEGVTRFSPGDKLIVSNGVKSGTIAEYVVIADSRSVAIRPDGLDAAHGAALPLAVLTAATAVDAAEVRPGETVLV